jgi:anti-sigma-K factor RskA
MIDEKLAEQASLYVFDLLDPTEERAFVEQMEREPQLRNHVDELTATAASLAHTSVPRRLPSEVGPRLFDRLRKEEKIVAFPVPAAAPRRWLSVAIPWSIAAVLAIDCVALTSLTREQQSELSKDEANDIDREVEFNRMQIDMNALTRDRLSLQNELAELKKSGALAELKIANLTSKLAQAPNASAVVVWNEAQQKGVLKVQGLPRPAADQDYQLWVIDPQYKKPANGGVFPLQAEQTQILFAVEKPIREAQAFAVSLERKGGAPEAQGPIILLGH